MTLSGLTFIGFSMKLESDSGLPNPKLLASFGATVEAHEWPSFEDAFVVPLKLLKAERVPVVRFNGTPLNDLF